ELLPGRNTLKGVWMRLVMEALSSAPNKPLPEAQDESLKPGCSQPVPCNSVPLVLYRHIVLVRSSRMEVCPPTGRGRVKSPAARRWRKRSFRKHARIIG